MSALLKGEFSVQGQFLSGSNYTFLGAVDYAGQQYKTVYKPVRGEQPLWDFAAGSLAHREVAAYLLSEALGWDLVPPTVYRRQGPIGAGSVQYYVEHDPHHHYFNFSEAEKQRLRPAAVFDLIANNADRKGGHILIDEDQHIWLIDQGLCFHVEDKLRTVVWDFGGDPVPDDLLIALDRLVQCLHEAQPEYEELAKHLRAGEIAALVSRARHLRDRGCFPMPPSTRRSYPWPPV